MSSEALERERRLQAYRARFRGDAAIWRGEDLAALDWIDTLAASGHVGAERLLARVLHDEARLQQVQAVAPHKLHALAARMPRVAFFLVRAECTRERPDVQALERWLGSCSGVLPSFAAALMDLRAAGATMGQPDGLAMSQLLDVYWQDGTDWKFGFHDVDDLLMLFAKPRIFSADSPEYAAGAAMLKRAFELGNYEARQFVWRAHFRAAEDKHEVHAKWLAENLNPSDLLREACFEHAVRLDRAAGEQLQQLEEAARWYWRALRAGKPERQNILRHAPSCRSIAEALDPARSKWKLADADLAKAWYRRADELRGPGRAGG